MIKRISTLFPFPTSAVKSWLLLVCLTALLTPCTADARQYKAYTLSSTGPTTNPGSYSFTAADEPLFIPEPGHGNHIYSVFRLNGVSGTFINNGDISVSGFSGLKIPLVFEGITTSNCTIINNGTIRLDNPDALSAVYESPHSWASTFINNGDIYVTDDATNFPPILLTDQASFTNTHNITVSLAPGTPADTDFTAIVIQGAKTKTINNSGIITVDGASHCIRINGGTTELTNTGMLVTKGSGYEIFVAAGTKLVDTYNITLDGDPSQGSIGFKSGIIAPLDLNDALLTVSSLAGETRFNTEYKVFGPNGTITGEFSSTEAKNPDMVAVYTKGASRTDDTVKLLYTPKASTPNLSTKVAEMSIMHSVKVVQNRMATNAMMQSLGLSILAENGGNSVMVAEAGHTMSDAGRGLFSTGSGPKSSIFVMPYGSRVRSTQSPMGYTAMAAGITLGCEFTRDNTVIGFHGGMGRADIDFTGNGYSRNNEGQKMLTIGVHGGTSMGSWVLGTSVTPFLTRHDFRGMTGADLDVEETADYNSYGTVSRVLAGYRIALGNDIFMPTLGLTHFWMHRNAYATDANGSAWDTSYETMNDTEFQVTAGLHWMRKIEMDGFTMVPSLFGGLRQTLTDGMTTTRQSVPGAPPVNIDSKSDKSAINVEAFTSCIFDRWTLQLGYAGECSDELTEHGGWIRAKRNF